MQPLRPLAAFGRPAPSGSSFPPIPDISNFTGIFSLYGIAPSWATAGESLLVTSATALYANTDSPNIADYPTFASNAGTSEAEQLISSWRNQAPSAPSSEIAFTPSPYLRVATPINVTGAGTAAVDGQYLYDGIVDDHASYDRSGDGLRYDASFPQWELPYEAGRTDYISADITFYPQGMTWVKDLAADPPPTVAMSTAYADQAGWIDSVAADSPFGQFDIAGSDTETATVFVKFRLPNVTTEQTIIASREAGLGARAGFRLYVVGGELFVEQKNADGTLVNSKKVAVSANTWYLVSAVFDRTAAAADQTKFWLNGSSAGQTVVAADNVFGDLIVVSTYVFSLANTGEYYDGDLTEIWAGATAFGDTLRQETQTRLAAQYPIVTLS